MNSVGNDNLQSTLIDLLRSGAQSNFALTTLLDDYARYHAVLVGLGSLLVLLLTLAGVFFWLRLRKARQHRPQLAFERRVNATFGVLSAGVGLLMALLVAANASNALNPGTGFAMLAGTLKRPPAGTNLARLHQAFDTWLQSGSADVPVPVQASVAERLAWQQPKAIVCGILLVVVVALGVRLWRTLIRKSRLRREQGWTRWDRVLLGAGTVTVPFALVLMVMLVANTQAAFAPITLTMMFG